MKKIPPGAEACNVLVGELEFLNKPVVAFVRLSPAVLLNGVTEVPIATRLLHADLIKCAENIIIYPAEAAWHLSELAWIQLWFDSLF